MSTAAQLISCLCCFSLPALSFAVQGLQESNSKSHSGTALPPKDERGVNRTAILVSVFLAFGSVVTAAIIAVVMRKKNRCTRTDAVI